MLKSFHTEYPSEVSRNTKIYRDKSSKQGAKTLKQPKSWDTGMRTQKWDIRKTSVLTVLLKD